MKNPCFKIYRDRKGEWRWRLVGRNGRIVADSGEGYTRKRDCFRAMTKFPTLCVQALRNPIQ